MTRTILRIDPLLDFWWGLNIRRDKLAMWTGVYPGDAASWRKFLAALFEKAKGAGAVGLKQLQAYRRTLAYAPRTDGEVRFRGELSADEVVRLGDWIVHECSKLAHDLGWPHQVHVGTNNLPSSAPLPLGELAQRYPRQKLVLIHCWPYLEEAGYLAKFNANVYLDTCWQPVLNPEFLLRSLRTWLGYVPTHKVVCSHDATTLEMAVGSSRFTREALATVLGEVRASSGLGRDDVLATARALLFDNSLAIYGSPLDG
jgi:predicted TIM-barrel fold metal-dependent hydrolase